MPIWVLLTVQLFLMTTANFYFINRFRLKQLVINCMVSIIFSLLYLSIGILSTGLFRLTLITLNSTIRKTNIYKSQMYSGLSTLLFIFSDYFTLFISSHSNVHITKTFRFYITAILFVFLSILTFKIPKLQNLPFFVQKAFELTYL